MMDQDFDSDFDYEVQNLPADPDGNAKAILEAGMRFEELDGSLRLLADYVQDYPTLTDLVDYAGSMAQSQQRELEQALTAVAAFAAGMKTLQAQRDDALMDVTVIEEALKHWYMTDDDRVRKVVDDIQETESEYFAESALEYAGDVSEENIAETFREMTGLPFHKCQVAAVELTNGWADELSAETIEVLKAVIAKADGDDD